MAIVRHDQGIECGQGLCLDWHAHRTLKEVSGQVGKRSSLFTTEAFEINIGGVWNRNRDSLWLAKCLCVAVVVCHQRLHHGAGIGLGSEGCPSLKHAFAAFLRLDVQGEQALHLWVKAALLKDFSLDYLPISFGSDEHRLPGSIAVLSPGSSNSRQACRPRACWRDCAPAGRA